MLFQTFHKVAMYVEYEINKEYITLKYCENKLKPGLNCKGKCEMMKRLNLGVKKELPVNKSGQAYDLQLFHPGEKQRLVCVTSVSCLPHNQVNAKAIKSLQDIFRPPRV